MPKLLLVEDDENNRDMLSRRLIRKGYEVAIAINGVDACEKVRTESPALILMDMQMPIMDGYEATRRLKADPATRHIPLIGLSAHAMSGAPGAARGRHCCRRVSWDHRLRRRDRIGAESTHIEGAGAGQVQG